ncbi:hypothetical protein, partial [Nostoc sp.]|uniref:hypothetical protein n=1 Tax=Nostoc sp. TaxID=1180 RepID=UPI002FF81A36
IAAPVLFTAFKEFQESQQITAFFSHQRHKRAIIYIALKLSIAGWLLLIPPDDATQETLMLRRLSGLAIALSIAAFWDVLFMALSNPITLGYWILPTWQVGFVGLGVLVAMMLFLVFLK